MSPSSREERLLLPGHSACAGCGPAINVRHVLGALAAATPEARIVLVIPASCWTIIAGVWPVSAFAVDRLPDPLRLGGGGSVWDEGGASFARVETPASSSGPATAATYDIGFSGVSAAAERNEDILYVLTTTRPT